MPLLSKEELDAYAKKIVKGSTEAQGLPYYLEDPEWLARIAIIAKATPRPEQGQVAS